MVGRSRGETMDWEQLTDRLGVTGERVGRGLKSLFGSQNERLVRKLEPLIQEVADLEGWAQGLDADGFKNQTSEWKQQVADEKATLDDLMPRAFALVREASVRTLGLRHFDVQIVGGVRAAPRRKIGEMMPPGRARPWSRPSPLYLNALAWQAGLSRSRSTTTWRAATGPG